MRVDVFADNNRIIDYNSQNQNKSEEREEIDAHIHNGHQPQGSHEGNKKPHTDPSGQTKSKEERQGSKDQRKTEKTIFDK